MQFRAHLTFLVRQQLPSFREVMIARTPGFHFAVRASGDMVRVHIGPRGGLKSSRKITDEELERLAARIG